MRGAQRHDHEKKICPECQEEFNSKTADYCGDCVRAQYLRKKKAEKAREGKV